MLSTCEALAHPCGGLRGPSGGAKVWCAVKAASRREGVSVVDTVPRRPGLSVITTRRPTSAPSPGSRGRRSTGTTWSVRLRSPGSPVGKGTAAHVRARYAAGPLVLGHRGSTTRGCRENSVEAVLAAMATGADGVEVDVRLSRDGVLVCSHDAVVTTPLGRELVVSSTTASELVERSAGGSGGHLATLPEVLSALHAGRAGHLVVEAKPVADQVGAFRTARALAELLVPLCTSTTITVSSFDPLVLGAVRRMVFGTNVRTALLGHATESAVSVLRRVDEAGDDEAHLSLGALREAPHVVRMAHQHGISVTAWTVNGADLAHMCTLGVDAVITDDIRTARASIRPAPHVMPVAIAGGTAC